MNMVGTPCTAVQRSSAMAWSVASASKYSDGTTIAAPCATHTMIAQHHAEAVVEGHRDAQLILAGKPHALANQQAVVHKIVMAQQRAFGRAGGARGVLNVDGVVKFQRRGAGRQGVGGNTLAHLQQVAPGHHAGGRGRVSDKNQIAQVRQLGRLERPRHAAVRPPGQISKRMEG